MKGEAQCPGTWDVLGVTVLVKSRALCGRQRVPHPGSRSQTEGGGQLARLAEE